MKKEDVYLMLFDQCVYLCECESHSVLLSAGSPHSLEETEAAGGKTGEGQRTQARILASAHATRQQPHQSRTCGAGSLSQQWLWALPGSTLAPWRPPEDGI